MGAADVAPLLPLRAFPLVGVPFLDPAAPEDGRRLLAMARRSGPSFCAARRGARALLWPRSRPLLSSL